MSAKLAGRTVPSVYAPQRVLERERSLRALAGGSYTSKPEGAPFELHRLGKEPHKLRKVKKKIARVPNGLRLLLNLLAAGTVQFFWLNRTFGFQQVAWLIEFWGVFKNALAAEVAGMYTYRWLCAARRGPSNFPSLGFRVILEIEAYQAVRWVRWWGWRRSRRRQNDSIQYNNIKCV